MFRPAGEKQDGGQEERMDITLRLDINSTNHTLYSINISFINHQFEYQTYISFSSLILLAISLPFSPIGLSPELLTFLHKSNYVSDGNWIYYNIYTP